jgi:alanyl aminopeptidase
MKVALVYFAAFAALASAATPDAPRLMLDENAVPQRYRLDLTLVPGDSTFRGVVEIDVRVAKPTQLVWLNSQDLNIGSVVWRAAGGNLTPALTPEEHGFIGLQFDRPVSGDATVRFEYSGRIGLHSNAGIFALDEDGETYIYSMFETSDARRAFPCFDQPEFKTPWRITLHVPRAVSAFANAPQESESPESGGMKAVRFRESQPLPSYLVAFAAGRFETVDAGRVGHAPLRIIVPRGHTGAAAFAAKSIPQLLALEEKYFGRPYPYEKLDSLVMPISNFAMENAGLITYSQSLLLAEPADDTIERQRECALVTAHEMAHQWFGDLVTTRWWDDVWLNEAFATWMERKIVGEWKPEWHIDVVGVQSRLKSMDLDSLVSSRRIVQPIESDSDIANAFDDITYEKGSAVLRMFENYAGVERFRRGVQLYLRRYEWRAATTQDFLSAVSEGAGIDIAPAFRTFLDQTGVPLVSMAVDCSGAKPVLRLSQKRSLPIGAPAAESLAWRIPLSLLYRDDARVRTLGALLTSEHREMPLPGGCPAWLLGNNRGDGYYRVRYEGDLLDRLFGARGPRLSAAERVSELGNALALVDTGDVAPAKALALASRFAADPNHAVVEQAMDIAGILERPDVPDGLRPNAARFIREVFGARAEKLGWSASSDDNEETRLLRTKFLPFVAGEGGDRALIDGGESLARRWLKDRAGVEPDLVEPALEVAARFGDRDLWDTIHQQALAEKDPAIQERLLHALGSFGDRTLAEASLQLILKHEFDPRETFRPLLAGPLDHPETWDLPFAFVTQHLDELLSGLPREVGNDYASEFPFTGKVFCDAAHRREVDDFFRDRAKNYSGGERNLRQALETIDVCIARRKALEPGLAEFLKAR